MPEANEWNEARLLGLIQDKIEESHTWEYKSAGALGRDKREKDNIAKDVSAMANASGGTIIYGMAESSDAALKYQPARMDPVDSAAFSKEWLEHVISEIEPPINGLKIIPVRLANGSVYIVEIPQGSTAHQATDFRYYRRRNFEVLPMLDQEVRDVMNRVKKPRLELELLPIAEDSSSGVFFLMTARILNLSDSITAYEITIRLESIPMDWRMPDRVWQALKTYDGGFRFIFEYPLHPGDTQVVANWKAGDGKAAIKQYMSRDGFKENHDLTEAEFLEPHYQLAIRVFAKDQAAMLFNCRFSRAEMQARKPKRFSPSQSGPLKAV